MNRTFISLILFVLLQVSYGQPSSSTYLAFKLYNENMPVCYTDFCENYEIINLEGGQISPCESISSSCFDTISNFIYLDIGGIYPPFSFSLVYKMDTMTIFILHNDHVIIDSLPFHSGGFVLEYPPPDNSDEYIEFKCSNWGDFRMLRNVTVNWAESRNRYVEMMQNVKKYNDK